MPGHSPGTLLQNPIVNYSFAPAWDRIDLLLEPFYRRWDHIVYIDADHLVLKRFELTTLTSGARRPTPALAPRCARAPRLLARRHATRSAFPGRGRRGAARAGAQ